ncbi:hypothetical protein C8R32_102219 [Nitrosospira sp. Nsp5]|uniref:Uncharacterized protein n=1 Tax=Nitrosospira multiformis TaxID=1231 RepID=A0ABY0TK94_9PROT|nr:MULTISPECIES: hypothetical protein [Nitrosospira]PTR10130.1 hypothetical protein C8R32_102219 [Nitrosospira sp. Nsp5]SDQ96744.1 hypothetical protein SAMN05216402_3039 [Nitrosospira multiformis]
MVTTLGKKAKDTFAVLSLLGLLAVGTSISSVKADNLPDQSAIQTAVSPSEHSVLARRFEEAAKEMQVKADKQKILLEHYENKSYLYGKRAQDLQSHTSALIRMYEKGARLYMKEAIAHCQMSQSVNLPGKHRSDAHCTLP